MNVAWLCFQCLFCPLSPPQKSVHQGVIQQWKIAVNKKVQDGQEVSPRKAKEWTGQGFGDLDPHHCLQEETRLEAWEQIKVTLGDSYVRPEAARVIQRKQLVQRHHRLAGDLAWDLWFLKCQNPLPMYQHHNVLMTDKHKLQVPGFQHHTYTCSNWPSGLHQLWFLLPHLDTAF